MTKHTDGAGRAAKGIWKDGKIKLHADTDYCAFIESATTIIDQETGLPEITDERDRLREAHRAIISLHDGEAMWTARNISHTALAKEPKSG